MLMKPVNKTRQSRALAFKNPEFLSTAWLIQREAHYAEGCKHKFTRIRGQDEPNLIWNVDYGADKMSYQNNSYAQAYSQLLRPWTAAQLIVEVGILDGVGLAIWADIFSEACITGIDLRRDLFDRNSANLTDLGAFQEKQPDILLLDAYRPDQAVLNAHFARTGLIDVVIDDGPHTHDAIRSMATSLIPHLARSFLYIVEDNPGSLPLIRDLFAKHGHVRRLGGLVVVEALR